LMAADSCPDNFNMEVTVGESIKDLSCGCWMSEYNYNGFDGPFQDVTDQHIYFSVDKLPPEAFKEKYDSMDVDEEKVDDVMDNEDASSDADDMTEVDDAPSDVDDIAEAADTEDAAVDDETDAVAQDEDIDAAAGNDDDDVSQSVEEVEDSGIPEESSSDDLPDTGHLPDDVLNKILGIDGSDDEKLYVKLDMNEKAKSMDYSSLYLGICLVIVLCMAKWCYTKSNDKNVSMKQMSYHTFDAAVNV